MSLILKYSQKRQQKITAFLIMALWCMVSMPAAAHPVVNYALENASGSEIFWFYTKLGITHIIPNGFDHILFVVSLCLLSTNIKTILWQASAFTVAHSITLALSVKSIIVAPGLIVEPIIALSIVFVAIENIILSELKTWRILIVFMFGLIHGLGFASALNEIGIPPQGFIESILSFNLGVEIGQVLVILLVFGLIIIPFGKMPQFKKKVVFPISLIIALIASYWTIERIMLI